MAERTGSVGQGKSGKSGKANGVSPAPKKKRRLGRGLGSLLNAPVDIATGSPRSTGNASSEPVPAKSPAAVSPLSSPGLEVPGLEDPGHEASGQPSQERI